MRFDYSKDCDVKSFKFSAIFACYALVATLILFDLRNLVRVCYSHPGRYFRGFSLASPSHLSTHPQSPTPVSSVGYWTPFLADLGTPLPQQGFSLLLWSLKEGDNTDVIILFFLEGHRGDL